MTHSTQRSYSGPLTDRGLFSSDTTFVERFTEEMTGDVAEAASGLLEIGCVLADNYEVLRVLGRGGMGQVYEARDRILNRPVAIKVSWPHIGDAALVQEARALAALRGRGVPSVYAVGRYRDLSYCVMERLYGITLAMHMMRRFTDGEFAVREALEILVSVADALALVHRTGLIHRDLKPSNIMMVPTNRVVLLDFGLFTTESLAPAGAGICGSPRYMAPEVITASMQSGQAHLVDVYALGVIGFMLLTGSAPFDDASATRIMAMHVHDRPPPLEALRPEVPANVVRAIAQMLCKEPEERTFSAEAVAACLRRAMETLDPPGAGASGGDAVAPSEGAVSPVRRVAQGTSRGPV